MNTLTIEWDRCPDGVEHVLTPDRWPGQYFRYRSGRLEPQRITQRSLSSPMVSVFANADNDTKLIDFFNQYGLPGTASKSLGEVEAFVMRDRRDQIRNVYTYLNRNGSKKADVLDWVNKSFAETKWTSIRPQMTMHNGLPEMIFIPENLLAFMLMELMFMIVGDNRFTTCARCGSLFVTGSGTGRTQKAEFCKPACRVSAARVRLATGNGR